MENIISTTTNGDSNKTSPSPATQETPETTTNTSDPDQVTETPTFLAYIRPGFWE